MYPGHLTLHTRHFLDREPLCPMSCKDSGTIKQMYAGTGRHFAHQEPSRMRRDNRYGCGRESADQISLWQEIQTIRAVATVAATIGDGMFFA
jgi:hypothetical protein